MIDVGGDISSTASADLNLQHSVGGTTFRKPPTPFIYHTRGSRQSRGSANSKVLQTSIIDSFAFSRTKLNEYNSSCFVRETSCMWQDRRPRRARRQALMMRHSVSPSESLSGQALRLPLQLSVLMRSPPGYMIYIDIRSLTSGTVDTYLGTYIHLSSRNWNERCVLKD